MLTASSARRSPILGNTLTSAMPAVPHVRRVRVRNFKSIADAVVDLGALTVFVGANGAGKSNFTDVLAFVRDALTHSVDLAFKNRAGIQAVRRISVGHPRNIGVGLSMSLAGGTSAVYEFEIGAESDGGFRVLKERCEVRAPFASPTLFETHHGEFVHNVPGIRPKLAADRLALVAVSALEEFSPVFDFLTGMQFYSIVPQRLRSMQEADAGDILADDGRNAPAVLKRLEKEDPEGYRRVCRLLANVVEGVKSVSHRSLGAMETLEFRQDVGQKTPWRFEAQSMSDGTLRVLGLLLAIYQTGDASLVSIEEPESTVHPAVADLLLEVFRDAAHDRQILVTTHSPDILDSKHLLPDQVRVVRMERGVTQIGRMSDVDRSTVIDHLYTPGELLRNRELTPNPVDVARGWKQARMFDPVDA